MSNGGMMAGNDREFLRVKIDLPSFQFEVVTQDLNALHELRLILENVSLDDQAIYEEFVVQEIRAALSDQFVSNQQVMAAVKRLLKQEDNYRVARVDIDITSTIDLENNTRDARVQRLSVRRAVMMLVQDVETARVKQGIIHINGDIEKEDKILIVDHIHKTMPTAQLRAFQSASARGQKVVVECIFFGDFPEEEE